MSNNRTSRDEQTNDVSDSAFQQDDTAKLTSPSDTTLQHLPVEILEYILVKAVAMEVIGMRLAKSVWNKKIDPVIDRLRTVSSLWNSIVMGDIFRDQVTRILNGTAQKTIRLKVLYESPLKFNVYGITTLKDEIIMFGKPDHQDHLIKVYDRNNMDVVKDVVPLTGLDPRSISACNVSNCVYVLNRKIRDHFSILRIASTNGHWSIVSPLISEIYLPQPTLCVTASGSVVLSRRQNEEFAAISVCDANGSTENEIRLPAFISRIWDIIPKSNGNLVLVSNESSVSRKRRPKVDFAEIDLNGIIIRRYQSTRYAEQCVTSLTDSYERIWAADRYHGLKLLDSEFNHMNFTGQIHYPQLMHYNRARNEIVAVAADRAFVHDKLIIFRLKEM